MEYSIQSIGGTTGQSGLLNTKSIKSNPHAETVQKFGQSLTDDKKSSILKTIDVL
tara:strand:+ start:113 stop:277 length:165 start_codon:yes stop_codon:yes gene_type:complete